MLPLPQCKSPPEAVWRLTPRVDTVQGWWVHEVEFYSDSDCSQPLRGADRAAGWFGTGPHGIPAEPTEAFDGLEGTFWQAPCQGTSSYDACMCNAARNEGWSSATQRCVVGETTSPIEEEACIANRASAVGDGLEAGCPASTASVGIHLWEPATVRCVRVKQHQLAALAASSLTLEMWAGHSWQEVRTWSDLQPGVWATLRPHESCSSFPAAEVPAFAEILGGGVLSAAHGESLTIKCEAADYSMEVTCYDGQWSQITQFVCPIPTLPDGVQANIDSPTGGRSSLEGQEDTELTSAISVLLGLLGLGVAVVLLLVFLHFTVRYMRYASFQRLVHHGAATVSPEAPPKGSLQDLLENGLPGGGLDSRGRVPRAHPSPAREGRVASKRMAPVGVVEDADTRAARKEQRAARKAAREAKASAGGPAARLPQGLVVESFGVASIPPPLPPPPASLHGETSRAQGNQVDLREDQNPSAVRYADTIDGQNLLRFGMEQGAAQTALRGAAASSSSPSVPASTSGSSGFGGTTRTQQSWRPLAGTRFGRSGGM